MVEVGGVQRRRTLGRLARITGDRVVSRAVAGPLIGDHLVLVRRSTDVCRVSLILSSGQSQRLGAVEVTLMSAAAICTSASAVASWELMKSANSLESAGRPPPGSSFQIERAAWPQVTDEVRALLQVVTDQRQLALQARGPEGLLDRGQVALDARHRSS